MHEVGVHWSRADSRSVDIDCCGLGCINVVDFDFSVGGASVDVSGSGRRRRGEMAADKCLEHTVASVGDKTTIIGVFGRWLGISMFELVIIFHESMDQCKRTDCYDNQSRCRNFCEP